jgi:hypothetical protein
VRHKTNDSPIKNKAENRILLYFASHFGRNISNPIGWVSVYLQARDVNGHLQLFTNSTIPSIKIKPIQYQTSLLTLLNAPA